MCPGKKRKNWRCQSYRWFRRSVRDHIRAQMIFIAVYGTHLLEERLQWYIIYDIASQIVCSHGWLIPMLISWVLTKSTKHSTNSSRQYLYIKKRITVTIIEITWRLFFVCSSCLFTFSLSRGHAYQARLSLAMHNSSQVALKLYRSPLFACFIEDKSM